MKHVILALSALFLAGCSVGSSGFFEEKIRVATPQESAPALAPLKPVTEEKAVEAPKRLETGYVKGIVRSVVFDGQVGLWRYEVEGTDTTNAKLPFASFAHTAPVAATNDRVYVRIEGGRLKELYALDKPSAAVAPPRPVAPSASPAKRTLDRQMLSVPQSETIVFD
jgi:hypothetical protein